MYGIKRIKLLRTHLLQEITANTDFKIRVDTTVAELTNQTATRLDVLIYDKKRREVILIEFGRNFKKNLLLLLKIESENLGICSSKS